MDTATQDAPHEVADGKHVTLYEVSRHYGGPEEGDWWYDTYEVSSKITSCGHDEKSAYAIARALNRLAKRLRLQADGARYQGRFSVADPTDLVYIVEDEYGQHDNTNEPHFYC